MNSVAVQTDLTEDEETTLNSISMGIFADILNILDDENHKIYYDISETFTCPDSKWSAEADAEDLTQDFLPSAESQQDIAEPEPGIEELTTEELEKSVRLSEFRLQTNLAALAEIQNKEEHVKDWFISTNGATCTDTDTPSEAPLSPQIGRACSFSELSGHCSPALETSMVRTNGTKSDPPQSAKI